MVQIIALAAVSWSCSQSMWMTWRLGVQGWLGEEYDLEEEAVDSVFLAPLHSCLSRQGIDGMEKET